MTNPNPWAAVERVAARYGMDRDAVRRLARTVDPRRDPMPSAVLRAITLAAKAGMITPVEGRGA